MLLLSAGAAAAELHSMHTSIIIKQSVNCDHVGFQNGQPGAATLQSKQYTEGILRDTAVVMRDVLWDARKL